MITGSEQLIHVAKNNHQIQLESASVLAQQALDCWQQLLALGMTAIQSSMEQTPRSAQHLSAAKNPLEWMSLIQQPTNPPIDKTLACFQQATHILSKTQAALMTQIQTNITANTQAFNSLVNEFTKITPAGSAHTFDIFKLTLGQAGAGYQAWLKATQQAGGVIESQLSLAAKRITPADKNTGSLMQ